MESVNARRALLLARMEREDRELDQQDPQIKYDEVQVVAHRPVLMRPQCSYLTSVQLPSVQSLDRALSSCLLAEFIALNGQSVRERRARRTAKIL